MLHCFKSPNRYKISKKIYYSSFIPIIPYPTLPIPSSHIPLLVYIFFSIPSSVPSFTWKHFSFRNISSLTALLPLPPDPDPLLSTSPTFLFPHAPSQPTPLSTPALLILIPFIHLRLLLHLPLLFLLSILHHLIALLLFPRLLFLLPFVSRHAGCCCCCCSPWQSTSKPETNRCICEDLIQLVSSRLR